MQDARRPEEFWERMTLRAMNRERDALAHWGLSFLDWQHAWNVLDIGCGGGANIARMLDLCPKGLIYGIDASAENVAFARKHNSPSLDRRCFIAQGMADRLPFDVDTFDAVTAFEAIYFWPDLEAAFAEVYRVLKPGGYFLICCEASETTVTTWTRRAAGMKLHAPKTIEEQLTEAGFEQISVHHEGKEALCIIAREGTRSEI